MSLVQSCITMGMSFVLSSFLIVEVLAWIFLNNVVVFVGVLNGVLLRVVSDFGRLVWNGGIHILSGMDVEPAFCLLQSPWSLKWEACYGRSLQWG